ncbi:MAG: hypothetical protein DIU66_000985 [Bacillota bacterium]|nr:MAG: hypothetical protein DIU66_02915 [Bacillota bacterium]
MESLCIVKQFRSKKNRVYLVHTRAIAGQEQYCILKIFKNTEGLYKESELLEILKGKSVRVPQILRTGSNYLILEYVDGENLTDLIERMENKRLPPESLFPVADSLCEWLKSFYEVLREAFHKNIIMKDVNLRNFIVMDEKIYGIDFEEAGEGSPEEDLGKICAFLLTYEPEYTKSKLELVRYIFDTATKKLNLNPDAIAYEMERELFAIKKRRNLKIWPYLFVYF